MSDGHSFVDLLDDVLAESSPVVVNEFRHPLVHIAIIGELVQVKQRGPECQSAIRELTNRVIEMVFCHKHPKLGDCTHPNLA